MDYIAEFRKGDYTNLCSEGLISHIESNPKIEHKTVFTHPPIQYKHQNGRTRRQRTPGNKSIRLPARINSPLIPYSQSVKNFILQGVEIGEFRLHDHHFNELKEIRSIKKKGVLPSYTSVAPITFDINVLRSMCRSKYTTKTELINAASASFASKATSWELSIAAMEHVDFQPQGAPDTTYLSFLIFIQRLRVFLAQVDSTSGVDMTEEIESHQDAELIVFKTGSQIYHAKAQDFEFYLIMCGGHFQLYHSSEKVWFAGSIAYLDYMFTTADILNNIAIILTCDEYAWSRVFLTILSDLSILPTDHNAVVNFMKGLEGFLLNLSDYDENYAMNWKPILTCIHDLWKLDQVIIGFEYPFLSLFPILHHNNIAINKKSFLAKIINCRWKLTGNQLQELSSLHKFIFYAEVDAMAGVEKFLGRVHTKRKVDPIAVKNITRLAKRLFFTAYTKKHKTIPNMLGPHNKVQLLAIYGGKNNYEKIEALGLTWWDDICIYNCMDNTLTEDPLEFAKDKGAIKSKIHLGPGDSRKELLQVIEKENYILKEFFSDAPFIRKEQAIYRTIASEEIHSCKFPARLIEKEREQKVEARLFANGELENKHALSVIATKMKKVLNYYDEQLMTPQDKVRKELIHEAAQELLQPDVYSLMLDIEGHNQSMQEENTSELAEFFGNLFGQFGWGSLPNYFGQLDVYHYDEYEDKVILSTGQYGGIEGWLNPFWTLHTTLMIKLIREMTSIDVRKAMIYSDDVNAIITLPDANEHTVNKTFKEIISHCSKFGMTVKMSQTALSKHRITMLRQHFFDGMKSDSTLKKMISTSGANNPMIMSDEIEVAGICSSIASAMEGTNHSETCCYLKNFKLGLLTSRLPHSILSRPANEGPLSMHELPKNLSNLLYQVKDDTVLIEKEFMIDTYNSVINDISRYLNRSITMMRGPHLSEALKSVFMLSVAQYRFVDSADRVLYLQIYDIFIKELLFFWLYLPTSMGGLGASLHINLFLSGHSCGFSKSLHYLHKWISEYSSSPAFFFNYLEVLMSVDESNELNLNESRLLTSNWPCDSLVTSASTSITQSLKSMVRKKNKNKMISKLFMLDDEQDSIKKELICIFRENFHTRIVQFYYENTSSHFIDLLINKIETSSSILSEVSSLPRLRNSLVKRSIENIRIAARSGRTSYGSIGKDTQTVEYCIQRRSSMFSSIKFIEVDEILYDNLIEETVRNPFIITVRQSSPYHYDRGVRVFDQPHVGNEILYKGELLEEDRMIGNKEELLAAKLVTITKWMLMKGNVQLINMDADSQIDCVKACDLSLSTLTGQTFDQLVAFSPTEVGGEILHRIPNMRFNSGSYLRSEYNKSLKYTSDIDQRLVNSMGLVDSNINFDYLRLRLVLSMIVLDRSNKSSRFIARYVFKNIIGIHDVQFITPKPTKCRMMGKYTSYSALRGHTFSEMKFRFMASHYLYNDNILDISTIPNLASQVQITSMGDELIDDMILTYMKKLDSEHMSISNSYIDVNSWKPLISRIKMIKVEYADKSVDAIYNFLAERLSNVLIRRHQPKLLSKKNSLITVLQNQCIQTAGDMKPIDSEFLELTERLLQLSNSPVQKEMLFPRLAKYQNALIEFDDHRRRMSLFIAIEYLLMFNISVIETTYSIELNVEEMMTILINNGISLATMTLLCPQIAIQINLIGHQPFDNYIKEGEMNIRAILEEIKDENILANLILPDTLPSTGQSTVLTGHEIIPEETLNLSYAIDEISNNNMETLAEILPLLQFAKRCSYVACNPQIFTSITGSDSLSSQYALFNIIKDKFQINGATRICDLTAGRGDFQYVCRELELVADSYSLPDVFTQVYHHPVVRFDREYDVFDNSSLKFILSYHWVHIDISFTGDQNRNVCDLIFLLEENNIAYSIRLNSVLVENYELRRHHLLPPFQHYLSYPMNRYNRPYQIYLIGVPGDPNVTENETSLRNTSAFKSIAYGYSRMLTPFSRELKLLEYEPNSISIYLPDHQQADLLIKQIIQEEVINSKIYYIKRFLSEMSEDPVIYWCQDFLDRRHFLTTTPFLTNAIEFNKSCYDDYDESKIGQVSNNSRKYKVSHLEALHSPEVIKHGVKASGATQDFLFYMRSAHPLQPVRAQCNIALGMNQFNYEMSLIDLNSMRRFLDDHERLKTFSSSQFQRDFSMSFKLLILSAFHGDYLYGLNYLWSLIRNEYRIRQTDVNMIKIYRSISYLYDRMIDLIGNGSMTIQDINSLRQSLSRVLARRSAQKRSGESPLSSYIPAIKEIDLINIELDNLFKALSHWVENQPFEDQNENNDEGNIGRLDQNNMYIDININDQIEASLRRLGISSPNQYGYIDIGDDYDEGETEW